MKTPKLSVNAQAAQAHARLLGMCEQFGIKNSDDLKHRLEDYERWNHAVREVAGEAVCAPEGLATQELVVIAEEMIGWIAGTLTVSRRAGRAALLGLLISLRDHTTRSAWESVLTALEAHKQKLERLPGVYNGRRLK